MRLIACKRFPQPLRVAAAGLLLCGLALSGAAVGSDAGQIAITRAGAQALQTGETVRRQSAELLAESRTVGDATLIQRLQGLLSDPGSGRAEAEAAVMTWLAGLRNEPPGTVGRAVLDWLSGYQPRVVRAHEEGPHHAVPAFNIPAAAAGLANQWRYQSARSEMLVLGGEISGAALRTFVDRPDSPRTRGYRAAIAELPEAALERLVVRAQGSARLYASELYPAVQLARERPVPVADWLGAADPAPAARVLADAAERLDAVAMAEVTLGALAHADAGVAALAMARFTDRAGELKQPLVDEWIGMLVELLPDRRLGGPAALQLARVVDDAELRRLLDDNTLDARARRHLQRIDSLRAAVSDIDAGGSEDR